MARKATKTRPAGEILQPAGPTTVWRDIGAVMADALVTFNETLYRAELPEGDRRSAELVLAELHDAYQRYLFWNRKILTTKAVYLGPLLVLCARCEDDAYMIPMDRGPGLAVCRCCSFNPDCIHRREQAEAGQVDVVLQPRLPEMPARRARSWTGQVTLYLGPTALVEHAGDDFRATLDGAE